jgi:hypothetical protein
LHAQPRAPIQYATANGTMPIDQVQSRLPRMCDDNDQTKPAAAAFDFSAFPFNTLFHERRTGAQRRRTDLPDPEAGDRSPAAPPASDRRAKKDRRRRIDPTTFEKQYTTDEMEFMNAMQRFKEASGKSFPTHAEVLKIAIAIGYRLAIDEPDSSEVEPDDEPSSAESSAVITLG